MGDIVTKGKIGEDDFNHYDGVNSTFSRLTSTGGTASIKKIGTVVDVLMAYGSGSSFTNGTISSAIKSIGSNSVTLLLRPGTWAIDDDLTVPSNFSLHIPAGVTLNIATGKTLTINGYIYTGIYQIFSCTGTGAVAFGNGPIKEFYPEWWGWSSSALASVNTAALQAAITAAPAGSVVKILPSSTNYSINDVITVSKALMMQGSGYLSCIEQTGTDKNGFNITASNVRFNFLRIKGRQYASAEDEYALYAYGASSSAYISGFTVDNCFIDNWGYYGIYMEFVSDFSIQNNKIDDLYYAAVMGASVKRGDIGGNKINNIVGTPNAYGIQLSRLTQDSITAYPRSSDVSVHDNVVRGIPNWMGFGAHGGQRISFVGNKAYGCYHGFGFGGAADTSGYAKWAPLECKLIGNEANSGVLDGTMGYAYFFTGALESTTVHERATGCFIGNSSEGYGLDASLGTSFYFHTTDGLIIDGNVFYESSRAAILGTTENKGFKISNNTIINPWTVAGTCYGMLFNDINNTGFIDGNIIIKDADRWADLGTTAPASVLDIGIRIENVAGSAIRIGVNECGAASYISDPGQLSVRGDTGGVASSGLAEDNLCTQTIPAGYIGVGNRIRIVAAGYFTGGNGNKTLKFYFGSALTASFITPANSTGDWRFEADIICDATAHQKISWIGYDGATPLQGWDYEAEDMTAAITTKITGECADAADVITCSFMDVRID